MQEIYQKPFYSVKSIFQENWEDYLKTHKVREIERIEVEKMLSCKDESRGGFWYYCKNCNEYLLFHSDAIQGYALAAARGILTNGHQC